MPPYVFWNARMHLNKKNNLVYFGNRVIIPTALKQDVLDGLHYRQTYKERETHASAVWSQHHPTALYCHTHR